MNPKTKDCVMFALGIAICFAIAGLSVLAEKLIPGELLGIFHKMFVGHMQPFSLGFPFLFVKEKCLRSCYSLALKQSTF